MFSRSFHQYSRNSEVETTWNGLICWRHRTSITQFYIILCVFVYKFKKKNLVIKSFYYQNIMKQSSHSLQNSTPTFWSHQNYIQIQNNLNSFFKKIFTFRPHKNETYYFSKNVTSLTTASMSFFSKRWWNLLPCIAIFLADLRYFPPITGRKWLNRAFSRFIRVCSGISLYFPLKNFRALFLVVLVSKSDITSGFSPFFKSTLLSIRFCHFILTCLAAWNWGNIQNWANSCSNFKT